MKKSITVSDLNPNNGGSEKKKPEILTTRSLPLVLPWQEKQNKEVKAKPEIITTNKENDENEKKKN